MRDFIFLAALVAAAIAGGVMAARTSAAFLRWAIMRTLTEEW